MSDSGLSRHLRDLKITPGQWVGFAAIIVLTFLVGTSLTWWLWCLVLGYFWPTGPQEIIDPSYGMFVALLCLLGMLKASVRWGK